MTNMSPKHSVGSHRLDATDIPLGRLATRVADLLRGKGKPSFVYHQDQGDAVTVIHASRVKLTGNKLNQKVYQHHTDYLGHLKTKTVKDLLITNPGEIVERAVAGMLPKNRLRAVWLKRLTVLSGEEGAK
jgi:large subunit ribosomal protein L13